MWKEQYGQSFRRLQQMYTEEVHENWATWIYTNFVGWPINIELQLSIIIL